MKFPSEYELIHNVSPLEGSEIKCCESKEEMFEKIEDDIKLVIDERPVIIISSLEEIKIIIEMLKKNNWNKYRVGA